MSSVAKCWRQKPTNFAFAGSCNFLFFQCHWTQSLISALAELSFPLIRGSRFHSLKHVTRADSRQDHYRVVASMLDSLGVCKTLCHILPSNNKSHQNLLRKKGICLPFRTVLITRIKTHCLFTARRYASAVYAVVICLSVCLSVCLSQTGTIPKMAKCRITQTTPYDSPGTLSFLMPKISEKFRRGHSQRGRQMEVG